jgi:hypothetical protein
LSIPPYRALSSVRPVHNPAFKYCAAAFYIVFFALFFSPLEWDLHTMASGTPSSYQRIFFLYAAHPLEFWITTFLALLSGQIWCERRFARMEI